MEIIIFLKYVPQITYNLKNVRYEFQYEAKVGYYDEMSLNVVKFHL